MTENNFMIEFNGEPVTQLSFQPDGRANVITGKQEDAIRYTLHEAAEVASAIGRGAEITEVLF